MKHITILVPEANSDLSTVACITGAYEIFSTANKFWKRAGKKELFKIESAGVSKKTAIGDGLITLKPETTISALGKTNLIIIPSIVYNSKGLSKENQVL